MLLSWLGLALKQKPMHSFLLCFIHRKSWRETKDTEHHNLALLLLIQWPAESVRKFYWLTQHLTVRNLRNQLLFIFIQEAFFFRLDFWILILFTEIGGTMSEGHDFWLKRSKLKWRARWRWSKWKNKGLLWNKQMVFELRPSFWEVVSAETATVQIWQKIIQDVWNYMSGQMWVDFFLNL